MWQHTSKGSVPGISGNVDLDVAYYDFPDVIRKKGLNGFGAASTPAPVPGPGTELTGQGLSLIHICVHLLKELSLLLLHRLPELLVSRCDLPDRELIGFHVPVSYTHLVHIAAFGV